MSGVTSSIASTNANTIEIHWDPITDYPCPHMNYLVEYELISRDQCQLMPVDGEILLADEINESSARLTGLEFYSTYLVYIRATHAVGSGPIVRRMVQTGETGNKIINTKLNC